MAKQLILTMQSWDAIRNCILEKYPPSILLIRAKTKTVLGFTVREHQEWKNIRVERSIHLDFYDEPKRTMFLLKYADYIEIGKTFT